MNITKKDFEAYNKVRESGRTNMFMITEVINLSGLTREKIKCIMENYKELNTKYDSV